jgi:hypothetical protein
LNVLESEWYRELAESLSRRFEMSRIDQSARSAALVQESARPGFVTPGTEVRDRRLAFESWI